MKWFALTMGGTLLGAAVWALWQNQYTSRRAEPERNPPVEKLAEQLQHAWAEPHNTAV
jgi:hypothetical protein